MTSFNKPEASADGDSGDSARISCDGHIHFESALSGVVTSCQVLFGLGSRSLERNNSVHHKIMSENIGWNGFSITRHTHNSPKIPFRVVLYFAPFSSSMFVLGAMVPLLRGAVSY